MYLPEAYREKYPLTYAKRIRCGFFCPDEWTPAIEDLSEKIESHLKENPNLVEGFSVDQVKEKFGGLRFYVSGSDETIDNLIIEAEREVARIEKDLRAKTEG